MNDGEQFAADIRIALRVNMPAALQKKGALANGEELASASGLMHGTYRGLRTVRHGGADAGELAHYQGLYWQRGTDNYRKLVAKNGALEVVYGQTGTALKAVGGGVFAGRTSDLRVEVDANGCRRLTETVRGKHCDARLLRGRRPVRADGCPGRRVHRGIPQRGDRAGLLHRTCWWVAGSSPA